MYKNLFIVFILIKVFLASHKIHAQCPSGVMPTGPELIVNGDFEQGNIGFTSGYYYCNTSQCVGEGDYGVHSNPSFLHQDFVGSDHTTGTGNFMMVNGAVTPGVSVWCQTVNVTPNTTYLLSAWVITIAGSYAPAELKFTINGVQVGNIFDAPDTFFVWDQFTATWNSGTSTTADICIEAVSTHFGGNDFGLDDISFIPCQCNINANASLNTNICTGDTIQLNSTGGTNYLWQPPTNLSNPNIPDPLAFPDTTTTYSVIISNGTGCVDTIPVTITVDEPYIDAGPDITIIAGDTITVNLSTGGNVTWTPSTGISCDTCTTVNAFPTSTTTYIITSTNPGGCTAVDTLIITVNNPPLPVICTPGQIPTGQELVVNGDFSQGNTGFTSGYIPGTGGPFGILSSEGEYAIATDPLSTHIDFDSFGDHTTGSGQMLVVNGASVPNISVWCQTIPVQPNTDYIFSTWVATVFHANPAILQFSINGVNLAAPFNAPPLGGGWSQFFATWNSGTSTTADICIINQNTAIWGNDFALDDISFQACVCNAQSTAGSDTTICEGASVQLTASGGDTYQWFPATGLNNATIANPVATVFNNTIYNVVISTTSGCIDTLSVTVDVITAQAISAGVNDTICTGSSIQLSGTGNGTITWSPSTGLNNPNIINPVASPAQTTTYILSVDTVGCVLTDSITITVVATQNIDAGINDTICAGSSIQLSGIGNGTITWSPSSGLNNPNIINPVASPTQTTTYILSVDSSGCMGNDSITITVNPPPYVHAGVNDTICEGVSIQLNGVGNGNISWSPATGLNNPSILDPVASPMQTTTYILNSDSSGCINTDTVVITVLPPPVISAGNNDTICAGTQIQLSASGANSYQWSPSTSLNNPGDANPIATLNQTTTFTVSGNFYGCTDTSSVTITVIPPPAIEAGSNVSVCEGATVQLTGMGNGNVSWSPSTGLNNANIINPIASPSQTTSYVMLIDSAGCIASDTMTVTVIPAPPVSAGDDAIIIYNSSHILTGSPPNGNWSTTTGSLCSGCTNYNINVTTNNEYYYSFTDINGCERIDTVFIFVKELCVEFFPNAFTPNKDGLNEVFQPVLPDNDLISEVEWSIYNRWGEQVFYSTSEKDNWDGKLRKVDQPEGVYVYSFKYKCDEETKVIKGRLMLIR